MLDIITAELSNAQNTNCLSLLDDYIGHRHAPIPSGIPLCVFKGTSIIQDIFKKLKVETLRTVKLDSTPVHPYELWKQLPRI